MIPKINSLASSYDARSSFNFSAYGSLYRFIYDESDYEATLPLNYSFQDDALTEVIDQTAKGLNLSFASETYVSLIDVTLGITQGVLNNIFGLWQNALIAAGIALDTLGLTDGQRYGWRYHFTGSDPTYPGHETYGTAYGFRFRGWGFEIIDIVLDSQGHLYGSNPIGNYTNTEESSEFIYDHIIHQQIDPLDPNEWAIPQGTTNSFNDLKVPYFEGKDLHWFFLDSNNVEHEVVITNFTLSLIGCIRNASHQYRVAIQTDPDNSHVVTLDGEFINPSNPSTNNSFYWKGVQHGRNIYEYWFACHSANLPCFNFNVFQPNNFGQNYNILISTQRGIYNDQIVQGSCSSLFMDIVSGTPISDPVEVPVDVPIPFDDIPEDPTDYDPDPDEDPDPVPGIDYPTPEPEPVPVPPIPPIVSGNDDLWPDLNDLFNAESDLDSFLNPLQGFEFTSFENLTSFFSSSIIWVSSIMMLLYNGSDFSVLFSVLSIFFIAAALLGIYKWWVSR